MAEQKKTTPVKPKKTTAVSESGERRVVLSAKTDPLAFLQEEKKKLTEEIEKGQETDEALKAQLTPKKEAASSEFTVSKSRKAANREAEQAWEDAKKQMAQWSENSSFDWIQDDPVDEPDEEEEGILISRAKRQAASPAQRRNRGYDRTKQILAVCLIFVAMAVSVGGFLFDKLDLGRISNLIGMVAGKDFGQIFITDTDQQRLSGIVDRITEDRAYFNAVGGVFTRIG